ncbi:DEAD/DEAH box helicase [Bacillus sp. L381]|uniref:DEAD/DEAH box helicase n=1 Tax=Bacillus TaxID=1386 RepID=UPI001BA56B58|nr:MULTISPECIES: DEAD/DEAH box helicase [Bacillus]MCR9039754.1 DEAD/DEAH box helicase [Bacillus velezensis]QUN09271.1 DEAD/DEAH box helicase [Bacillus amyloliquefaciens]QYM82344.1 DEAD/DEAH box helicase [Bacillus sp. 7D3]QZY11575.1 DEAD/DEAH box helicase [Bacillus amyloliquefaciens]WIX21395.1 DEAD/DEAH box helicase [Bacillus sp. L381]
MASLKEIFIHVEQMEDWTFTLSSHDEKEQPLTLSQMKTHLFQWHESTFYGTFLEDVSFIGTPAVLLSPWMTVELLGKNSFNSFSTVQLTKETEPLIEAASTIYEFIADGDFLPDYDAWQNGVLRFKDRELLLEGFTADWFSAAVQDYIQYNDDLREKWQHIETRSPAVHTFKGSFLDEDDFLEGIGWHDDLTPFTVGLRLNEPDFDGDDWKIEMFLREKKTGAITFFDGLKGLKKAWQAYSGKIAREQDRFRRTVPWLSFDSGTTLISEEEAWIFLSEASETLVDMGVEILLPSWWQIVRDSNMMLKAKVSSSPRGESFVGMNALLDFNWRFATNGIELTEDEFNELVANNRRLVNIRGQWVKIDPQFIKQMKKLMEKAESEGLHMSDVLARELMDQNEDGGEDTDIIDSSAFAGIKIELSKQLRSLIRKLADARDLPEHEVSAAFQGTLRPYQIYGMNWLLFLRENGFGACLADDMGLGKTIQMIAYFLHVKESGRQKAPALIIAPTSVLGNWQRELQTFAPQLKAVLHYGPRRPKEEAFVPAYQDADVVLTSYGLSHADQEELSSVTWSTICLDEAQNIKNAHTKQSRAIRKLKGVHHIALSGTPMENRLTELWSIFDFMNKGYLGSLTGFHKRYVLPIEKDRDEKRISQLQQLIRPFLLRRTKRDEDVALNLPDKLEEKEFIPLSAEQASLYEQLVKDTFEHMASLTGMQRKALILSMLGRLKQICDHPALYLKEEQTELLNGRSVKLEKLLDLMAVIRGQGESCLIFTQYIQMGNMMKRLLEKTFGEPVQFLNGSLSKQERDSLVERFQKKEYPTLILSLKAGGTGLNLTAANHVIHYDRWWNPAVENQATDRAYRIGQERFVHVHKLITTGTIEEKIDTMLETKQTLNDQIIQSENWITELSSEELEELFTLSASAQSH